MAGSIIIAVLYAGIDDEYTLEITKAGHYLIDMMSPNADAQLSISGNGVEEDTDRHPSSWFDARLSLPLQPGSYRLNASGRNNFASIPTDCRVLTVLQSDEPVIVELPRIGE